MSCTKCHYEFCWLCLQDWKTHKACNAYEKDCQKSMSDAREQLKRFLHYSGRYLAHKQSQGLEVKLKEKVTNKVVQFQNKFSISFAEARFLLEAFEVLISCRTTLTYTFAFAYYLRDNNEKCMFEDVSNNIVRLESHPSKTFTIFRIKQI